MVSKKKATKGFFLKRSSFCREAVTLRENNPDRIQVHSSQNQQMDWVESDGAAEPTTKV